ncbi:MULTISPECIES: TetR/AcrR family transcriptional regulator [Streptomycetaceae]|uniref:TetR/AcrR family transcriptional regulator n=1 Tax=Streptomycetaceae TaxID=2062 RepID=UPI0005A93EF9|nr:TetR/AcrR family transcriptional regulator [Streptantibioticus cattleyicolor]MYS57624.1 TetR family transcriptional regulator [Streptomyces sp. SID5468]
MLAAADELFARADRRDVTIDDIAAAASVGKGTIFRLFGSRDGLLDTLWATKADDLRDQAENGPPPLGPGAPARDRAVAFLDAVLSFKLDNRNLLRAREVATPGLLQSEQYRWMRDLLTQIVSEAKPALTAEDAEYLAHALLAAVHIDLVEELLASGRTPSAIRRIQRAHVLAVLSSQLD